MEAFPPEITEMLENDDTKAIASLPNIFITTTDGSTLLIEAIRFNAVGCVEMLAQDERMKAQPDESGETPLMKCVIFERFGLIHLFTSQLRAANADGVTALMMAIEYGYKPEFEPLLAEQTMEDDEGITALMLAAQDGLVEWFPLLSREFGMHDADGLRAIDIARMRGVNISEQALLTVEP